MAGDDPRWGPAPQNITIELSHYNELLSRERELLDDNARLSFELVSLQLEFLKPHRGRMAGASRMIAVLERRTAPEGAAGRTGALR